MTIFFVCSAFSMWSLVLAEKPQKDEIFSAGCWLWNLYLKLWTDGSCVSYICGDAWCIAEDSKVDCYGWKQIVIYVNCGFQDHTQSEPLMRTSGTHTVTDANTYKDTYSVTHTFTLTHCVYLLFPTLSLVLCEWQSYFLHRLAYCSIKPLIGLDSSYLSPVEYGSLQSSPTTQ